MHDSFRVLLFPHSLAVFSVSLPHFLSLFSAFGVKKQEFRRHFRLRFLVQDSNKNRLFSPRFSSRETEAGETEEEGEGEEGKRESEEDADHFACVISRLLLSRRSTSFVLSVPHPLIPDTIRRLFPFLWQ